MFKNVVFTNVENVDDNIFILKHIRGSQGDRTDLKIGKKIQFDFKNLKFETKKTVFSDF